MSKPVLEGELLAGKYRVERILGQGGMGVVVKARHVDLDEPVALKLMLPEVASNEEAVGRFLREARAAVRVKSEHVARVIDVGQLESGAPYLVMEYLDGQDLAQILRERGPLPIDDAIDYLAQACEAVAEAHVLGVVHRDLKPANLMVITRSDGSECVKLLDFGISKVSSKDGASLDLTKTSALLGSPFYMSPEQMMSSRDIDGRTDVWALGIILFEFLTGHTPFVAETLPRVCALIATAEPPSLRSIRGDVPAGLDAVVQHCLEKNRDDRYADVAELAKALRPFAAERSAPSLVRVPRIIRSRGLSDSARRALDAATTGGDEPTLGASELAGGTGLNFGQTKRGAARRKWPLLGVALALVVGGVIAGRVALQPSQKTGEGTSASVAQPPLPQATSAEVAPGQATGASPRGPAPSLVAPAPSEPAPNPPTTPSEPLPTSESAPPGLFAPSASTAKSGAANGRPPRRKTAQTVPPSPQNPPSDRPSAPSPKEKRSVYDDM
jgi:serine/threonine-protein kinase